MLASVQLLAGVRLPAPAEDRCTKPFKEWVLARHPAERGKPIELLPEHVFTSKEDAEWACP